METEPFTCLETESFTCLRRNGPKTVIAVDYARPRYVYNVGMQSDQD